MESCPDNWTKNYHTKQCQKCSRLHCKKCQNNYRNICTECDDGFYLLDTNCVSSCPDGYFVNTASRHCLEKSCGSGFYQVPGSSLCVPCTRNCQTCSEVKCLACKHGYKLNSKDACEIESNFGYPKSALFSDDLQGFVWDPESLHTKTTSYADINPVFSFSYIPNQLSVFFIIKSGVVNKARSTFKDLFSASLTGESNGIRVSVDPSSFELYYITKDDEQIELRITFNVNQTLIEGQVKLWIDPSVVLEPRIGASLYSRQVGKLEYLSNALKSV
jgi:hypothetical protein